MLGAQHLLADRQRSLEKRPCRREVALTLKKDGEIVQARRSTEMLWALLADRQRSLEKRPCRREVALTLKKDGEIVQARRSTEMLWA
jgi:hypothetical protein